jgi:hypothetical protein
MVSLVTLLRNYLVWNIPPLVFSELSPEFCAFWQLPHRLLFDLSPLFLLGGSANAAGVIVAITAAAIITAAATAIIASLFIVNSSRIHD